MYCSRECQLTSRFNQQYEKSTSNFNLMPESVQIQRQVLLSDVTILKEIKIALSNLLKKYDTVITKSVYICIWMFLILSVWCNN